MKYRNKLYIKTRKVFAYFARYCKVGFLFVFLCSNNVLAVVNPAVPGNKNVSIEDVAENVIGIESNVHDFIRAVCIMGSIFMLFSSLTKYRKHRNNPLEASMGTVVTHFIIAVFLLILAFIPMPI